MKYHFLTVKTGKNIMLKRKSVSFEDEIGKTSYRVSIDIFNQVNISSHYR